ncbi:cbb3-type cytochrome oxidase assembly protein CcoS [Aquamicrobium terrae]|uniref:Cbb3-type cytochrome oxidase maturation protein n=1 Tax=Aquamicrobium terrae TaxID=1324945 RepID=A0ABV2MZN1_9HYPH
MSSLIYLVPLALVLGGAALAAFFWSLRSGQYDDLDGAAERIFIDEDGDKAGGGEGSAGNDAGKTPKEKTR